MPPKKKASEPSKKTEQKKKDKVVEDKTFGMKNKKGQKQQKFIKTVQHQVQHGNVKSSKLEAEKAKLLGAKKDEKKKLADELNALFKPVEQKVGKGVDPKSVVCAFFKQGLCTKGEKCKFSHDLNIGRKGEKRSMYEDKREGGEGGMEDWDEEKLEEVVNKKHGEKNKSLPQTSIVCKYFVEALENSKYGWFWECPNGDKCHYKHALPPGFQLKKDMKKEDKQAEISLEELIESERAALSSKNLTRVTLESFLKWKQRKKMERVEKFHAENERKKNDYKAGKALGISGRLMFEFNPDLVEGDDEDGGVVDYNREGSDDEEMEYDGPVKDISLEALASEAREADGTGSVRTSLPSTSARNPVTEDTGKMDEAGALPQDPGLTTNGEIMDTPIDENLFDGEDLDIVEEELEELELND